MRIVIPDHEVTTSTPDRIELIAPRVTLFTTGGSYVLSQNGDGTLRIETHGAPVKMDVAVPAPTPRIAKGPRILKSPKPRTVQCDNCNSTIEYAPEDLMQMPSLPSSDDVGPLAVKCPKPRCGGRGYPR